MDGIEQYIRWCEGYVPGQLRTEMDRLCFYMALVNQGEARKMSFGPYDPFQENSASAWKLPVRRISNTYYVSWKVRRVKLGVWQLYNDSREAFFIEFGINPRGAGRRVRRPVRKLSLIRTLDFMRTTQAWHRVWADIFVDPRARSRGRGFYQIVQSPGHLRWENVSQHEAAGVIRRVVRAGEGANYRRYVRMTHGGGWQVRRRTPGSGQYGGALLGRRLP